MIPKNFTITKSGFSGTYSFVEAEGILFVDYVDETGALFQNIVHLQDPSYDNPIVHVRFGIREKILNETLRLWHNIRMDLLEKFCKELAE